MFYRTDGLYIGKYGGITLVYQIDFDVTITVQKYESKLREYIVGLALNAKTAPLQYVYLGSIENFELLRVYDSTYDLLGGDRTTIDMRMYYSFNWADMMAKWYTIDNKADVYLYVDAFNEEIIRQFHQGE